MATVIAYEPMRNNEFVGYDDPAYITENTYVKGGLTQESIHWSFTSFHASNWHPLTWLSHMLDCQLYDLKPLGHHITNLLLHIANTLLLFRLLQKMTGAIWKSAFVAAAFALHPVHVESVAWAAERKDVLSALFWILTLPAYVRYTGRPVIGRYMLVILAFTMGLTSKPMLVDSHDIYDTNSNWLLAGQRQIIQTGHRHLASALAKQKQMKDDREQKTE